jgi:ferric-dicitrate binding protein FerR (iron transport regulator)
MKIEYHQHGEILFTVAADGTARAFVVRRDGTMVEITILEAMVMARDNV